VKITVAGAYMTGDELRRARTKLGEIWGLGRAACAAELGRALGNPSQDPGESIRDYERARTSPVPWLLATVVDLMLRGVLPPGGVPRPKLKGPPRRAANVEMAR
jgi:hypothetical protein